MPLQVIKSQRIIKAYIPLRRKIPGVGGWRWAMPPPPEFCLGDTNIPKICVTPYANPQHQSVEYRWCWAFWRLGWRWACTFHIFCVDFICVWWSTQTQYPVEYGLYSQSHCHKMSLIHQILLTLCSSMILAFSNIVHGI